MESVLEKLFYPIKPPLKVDCCSFASISIIATGTTILANSTTIDVA
jgi:hypothetical protein